MHLRARHAANAAGSIPKWHRSQGGDGFRLVIVADDGDPDCSPGAAGYELDITADVLRIVDEGFLRWLDENTWGATRRQAVCELRRRAIAAV